MFGIDKVLPVREAAGEQALQPSLPRPQQMSRTATMGRGEWKRRRRPGPRDSDAIQRPHMGSGVRLEGQWVRCRVRPERRGKSISLFVKMYKYKGTLDVIAKQGKGQLFCVPVALMPLLMQSMSCPPPENSWKAHDAVPGFH